MFWFAGLCAFAQNVTTSGTVSDEEGEPLIGVSVLVQGKTQGVTTDMNGQYTITTAQGSKLVFSYVGTASQTHEAVNGVLNITLMPQSNTLDQVVVVGYGVQRKSDVTGAISKVDGTALENLTVNNPTAALAGKTSGVQVVSTSGAPGASPTIRVRGYSSNSDMAPLYVVDGIRLSDISGIDPSQIESIEVLKDGASAAIYGAQAGNGVVLITTKGADRTKSGSIRYDFQYVNETIGHRPTMLNAKEYMTYMVEAGALASEAFTAGGWNGKTDTNWFDVAFGHGDQFKHTVTFEGSSDKGSLLASVAYLTNDGPVRGNSDYYKRLSGNINADYQIKPWFKVGTTAIIERWQTQSVSASNQWGAMLTSVYALDPLTPNLVSPNEVGGYANMMAHINELLTNADGDYYGISAFYTGENVHPMIMRDRATDKSSGFNVTGSAYAIFTPWKPLSITSRFGYRLSSSHNSHYEVPYFGSVQATSPNLSLNASNGTGVYYQWENFANYNQTFNEVHAVSAMAGLSFQKDVYSSTYGSANQDGDVPAIPVNNPLLWGYLDYANAGAAKGVGGGESTSTQYSWFGRVGYTYDNKYMIQASLRGDAYDNSKLPVSNRWGYFPSMSAGWTISQEDFMGWSRPAMDFLKIRFSWGKNGSVAPLGGYSYGSIIGPFNTGNYGWGQWGNAVWTWDTNQSGSYKWYNGNGPTTMGNNELSWETMTQWDLGFDARFFNNRLSFGFDYFHKTTDGLLVSGVVPTLSLGGVTSPINAGGVLNEGVEFDLGWQDRVGDFRYNISANISTLRNKVTKLHPSVPIINGASFSNIVVTRFEVGEKVWHYYGYDYAGVDSETGRALYWVERDGKRITTDSPEESDKTNIGDAIPDVTVGLNISLAYKGFDFNLNGSGQFGNEIYMCLQRQDRLTSNRMKDVFFTNRWTADNHAGTIPSAGAINDGVDAERYLFSSAMVTNGSFFKIRQIQLGYTIPKQITRKALIENFRAYVSLDDFFTFTKYKGLDPEVSAGTGSSQGLDMGGYPVTRKLSVGFNVTF
ncbi:MAG: SusC/RagA family TonB-linked outer membrane protein [Muribaculaceae bacterium]|nr:SusC/RagA family TonB-linked outer membrane protein [Muribaculaceae bacterium]